jgi:hypothetical protein
MTVSDKRAGKPIKNNSVATFDVKTKHLAVFALEHTRFCSRINFGIRENGIASQFEYYLNFNARRKRVVDVVNLKCLLI